MFRDAISQRKSKPILIVSLGSIYMYLVVIMTLASTVVVTPNMQGYLRLSHDAASGSDITPCNKIDIPLVVYRFSNVT